MFKRVMNTPSNLLFRILTSASKVFGGWTLCRPINKYYTFIKEEFKKSGCEIEFEYYLEHTVEIEADSFKGSPEGYFIVMACVILYIILPEWSDKVELYGTNILDQLNNDAILLLNKFGINVNEDDIDIMDYLFGIICGYPEIVKITEIQEDVASAMYVQSTC